MEPVSIVLLESFPQHKGRPHLVGGSLPKNAGATATAFTTALPEGKLEVRDGVTGALPKNTFSDIERAKLYRDIKSWKFKAKLIALVAFDERSSKLTLFKDKNGTLQGIMATSPMMGELHVHWLASNQKGVGTLLMREAFKEAVKLNRPLALTSSIEAMGFYAKLGMERDKSTINGYRLGPAKIKSLMESEFTEAQKRIDWNAMPDYEPSSGVFARKDTKLTEGTLILVESFPQHKGRPGEVGGSLPKDTRHITQDDYGHGDDATNSLPRATHNWLQTWQFGFEGRKANTYIPIPSQEVVDSLKDYRPSHAVILYRAIDPSGLGWAGKIQSWTRSKGHANIIASTDGEPDGKSLKPGWSVIRRTWSPSNIILDTTLLPAKYNEKYGSDLQQEVIVKPKSIKIKLKESFPDHAGRPGLVGGSLPKGLSKETASAETDRGKKKETLLTGEIVETKELGGGINTTKLITLADGTKAVFKENKSEALFEAAASDIAEVLGMEKYVPPTVVREISGQVGSVQEFRNSELKAAKFYNGAVANLNESTLADTAAFDYLIGNEDRHNGNWLTTKDQKKIVLIDHGLAWNCCAVYSRLGAQAIRKKLLVSDGAASGWAGKWPGIESALKEAQLSNRLISAAKERFDELVEAAASKKKFSDLKITISN